MNVLELYIKLLLLVVLPLVGGMLFSHKSWAARTSSRCFAVTLYFFHMVVVFLAVWTSRLTGGSWVLPLIVFAGWLLSIGVGNIGNRWLKHPREQRGSFMLSICLSNHGYTLLGIVALVVFGEAGLAQAAYAQSLIVPYLVLICFPMARHYSDESKSENIRERVRKNIFDKRNLPLVAMLAGLTLNLSGVERPAFFSPILRVAVYTGTIISGIAVGLLFNPARIGQFKRENLFSFIYRATLYPLFFIGAAKLLGLNSLDSRILILFGIAPSAIFSNLISDMFKLDKDLANSIYIISTVLYLIVVLPVYLFAVAR